MVFRLKEYSMSDKLNGQLTTPDWTIPQYARECLVLVNDSGKQLTLAGQHGKFALNAPSPALTLHWNSGKGPALACLPWNNGKLDWQGAINTGGYVDSIHMTELSDLDLTIAVLFIGGQPLKHDFACYPTAEKRKTDDFGLEFYAGVAAEVPESVTTWLVDDESSLMNIARDAMISNLRLHLYGHLAEQESGWWQFFALPILLEAATVFAP